MNYLQFGDFKLKPKDTTFWQKNIMENRGASYGPEIIKIRICYDFFGNLKTSIAIFSKLDSTEIVDFHPHSLV